MRSPRSPVSPINAAAHRAANSSGVAKLQTHLSGTRERGHSPWLGDGEEPSPRLRQYRDIDRLVQPLLGPLALGQSPATLIAASMDWWVHIAASPAKRLELLQLGLENLARLTPPGWAAEAASPPAEHLPQTRRTPFLSDSAMAIRRTRHGWGGWT